MRRDCRRCLNLWERDDLEAPRPFGRTLPDYIWRACFPRRTPISSLVRKWNELKCLSQSLIAFPTRSVMNEPTITFVLRRCEAPKDILHRLNYGISPLLNVKVNILYCILSHDMDVNTKTQVNEASSHN